MFLFFKEILFFIVSSFPSSVFVASSNYLTALSSSPSSAVCEYRKHVPSDEMCSENKRTSLCCHIACSLSERLLVLFSDLCRDEGADAELRSKNAFSIYVLDGNEK